MSEDTDTLNRLKLFGMHNLMLETELAKLEKKGINIGRSETVHSVSLVDLDLFETDILAGARKMADFYILYYCIENSIRRLISERMLEKHDADWWIKKVQEDVKKDVKELQDREKDSPMSIRSADPLSYTTFGQLIVILNANWSDFADTIRSQKAMQNILSQLNSMRAVVAHSADLNEDEISRFKLLIRDWLRIQT